MDCMGSLLANTIHCIITSKLKILEIIMWNMGMAKETRLGCLVHIVL